MFSMNDSIDVKSKKRIASRVQLLIKYTPSVLSEKQTKIFPSNVFRIVVQTFSNRAMAGCEFKLEVRFTLKSIVCVSCVCLFKAIISPLLVPKNTVSASTKRKVVTLCSWIGSFTNLAELRLKRIRMLFLHRIKSLSKNLQIQIS